MTPGRALGRAAWLILAAVALPGAAAAQFFPAQPAGYLMTIDASDGRALWVNPAGLARRAEASLGVDLAMERTPGSTRVSQFGALLASRNLAFGWSRDRLAKSAALPERAADVYALGLGLGDPVFSAGVAKHWYRGDARASAWDIGARVALSARFDVSFVWRDIGSPIVADTQLRETLVPAVAVNFLRGRLRGSVEWHVVRDGWSTSEIRTGWTVSTGDRLAVTLRTDLAPGLGTRRASLAAQWSLARSRATLFASDNAVGPGQTYGGGLLLVSSGPGPARRPRR